MDSGVPDSIVVAVDPLEGHHYPGDCRLTLVAKCDTITPEPLDNTLRVEGQKYSFVVTLPRQERDRSGQVGTAKPARGCTVQRIKGPQLRGKTSGAERLLIVSLIESPPRVAKGRRYDWQVVD